MYSAHTILVNPSGLQALPAALLVRVASEYQSGILLRKQKTQVDAKSLLGVLSLMARCGEEIFIQAEGEDEKLAVEALIQLIKEGLSS